MHRKILALLALAAGWLVLVADSADPTIRSCLGFDAQYAFQTHCMGEPASGFLNLALREGAVSHQYDETLITYRYYGDELSSIRVKGLNVQNVTALFKGPDMECIPIGFDFEIKGEPVDALQSPDAPPPTFRCTDSRAHDTLAVDKDYLCENTDNSAETCELKLIYQPPE